MQAVFPGHWVLLRDGSEDGGRGIAVQVKEVFGLEVFIYLFRHLL